MYRLFNVDEHWYLFFRYHQILCERLYKTYKQAQLLGEQERAEARNREQSVAEALKLRQKSEITVDEYYPVFLDIVRNLLDGNMDGVQYEDTLREMFGIHAYLAFTLDKVVHNCVRQVRSELFIKNPTTTKITNFMIFQFQLQYLVQDDVSISVKQCYLDEQKGVNGYPIGCGGKVSHMSHVNVMQAELAYQKRVESLLSEKNVFKIISVS